MQIDSVPPEICKFSVLVPGTFLTHPVFSLWSSICFKYFIHFVVTDRLLSHRSALYALEICPMSLRSPETTVITFLISTPTKVAKAMPLDHFCIIWAAMIIGLVLTSIAILKVPLFKSPSTSDSIFCTNGKVDGCSGFARQNNWYTLPRKSLE